MYKDPIVEEVRSIREEYAEQFAFDLHAICEDLRRLDRESDQPTVRLKPKVIPASKTADEPIAV